MADHHRHIKSSAIIVALNLVGLTGPIDAQRAHRTINAYSLAFFDKELKGQPAPLLDGPAKQYPEVVFETRRPGSTVQKP